MSDLHVDYDNGKITVFAREPENVSVAQGFKVLPWESMYDPVTWSRCGPLAGYGCYLVESRADLEKLVADHYGTGLTTPAEHASHVAEIERRAASFGLMFGQNWEPIFTAWEAIQEALA